MSGRVPFTTPDVALQHYTDSHSYNQHGISPLGSSGIPLSTGPTGLTRSKGAPFIKDKLLGAEYDSNAPLNRPVANLPTNITWIQDDNKRQPHDLHPGALVFINNADDGPKYHEPGKPLYWMKSLSALNYYLRYGEGRIIYRDCRNGERIKKDWAFGGIQWTVIPSSETSTGSALGDSNQALNFHICGMAETKDIWCVLRKTNEYGTQIGGLKQTESHLFLIYRRVREKCGPMDIMKKYPRIDGYYWRIEPYHQNTGAGLDVVVQEYMGNNNENHPNYHRIAWISLGRCTQRISQTAPNSELVDVAKRAIYPDKMSSEYIMKFGELPRIQLELKGQ